ncbi:MAG TPA: phosphoglycerate dehydrogenase [Verrucomicrobiae bacterium]|jgi:phosphoglycerate dehydrogenase-like enzyme|nr:phosphoglycerate dehydrogenase [Verrucomicrobiae bacterium]
MSWKVLITARGVQSAGEQAVALLQKAGCEIVFPPRFGPLKADELAPALTRVDAVLASLDDYSASLLSSSAAEKLKIIARWGVGYDSVDVAAATQNGIVVTYTPGLLDDAVADYTFALLLAVARRTNEAHAAMQQGEWKPVWGADVGGKTLGIIGLGRIGKAVARRAAGFNMRILAHTPHPSPENEGIEFVPLARLLAESDFVSLHAALAPSTRGMIGDAQLRLMKPSAYLINTARGALVDEAALARALAENRLAGAALDVYATEPLPSDSALRAAPNLLLSPHQSSCARDTGERVSLAAAQAIVDLMNRKKPQNVLNPEVFESPGLRASVSAATNKNLGSDSAAGS